MHQGPSWAPLPGDRHSPSRLYFSVSITTGALRPSALAMQTWRRQRRVPAEEAGRTLFPPAALGCFAGAQEVNPQIPQRFGCFLKRLSRTGLGKALRTLCAGWHGAQRVLPPSAAWKGALFARDSHPPASGWNGGSWVRGSPSLGPAAPWVPLTETQSPSRFPPRQHGGNPKRNKTRDVLQTGKKLKQASLKTATEKP